MEIGEGYSSPVAAGGKVFVHSRRDPDELVTAVDLASGRIVLQQKYQAPFTKNHLIVSGVRQGTRGFALTSEAGKWRATEAWKNADVTMYASAPVLADGVVYGMSSRRKGQFVALDAATGAVRWATEGREGDHASILLAPSHILFLINMGDLMVARRDPARFIEERRLEVADGGTWAVPVVVPGGLVMGDAQALARVAW